MPVWIKQGINAWMTAAGIEDGRLLRSIRKVEQFGTHSLRRTCAKLCRKAGGGLEQIKFLLVH